MASTELADQLALPGPATEARGGPVLVHVHIPKCGGTSIRLLLEKAFRLGHRDLYPGPHSFVYTEDDLCRDAIADPTVRSISSHFIRRFPTFIRGRRMLYFTFLRNPLDQFMSYYTYIKKVYSHIKCNELLASLPPNTHTLSSREFADWLLKHRCDVAFRENYTTNFLARYVWMDATERGPGKHVPWPQEWAPDHWTSYCEARLKIAKTILSNFFFVGTLEQLDSGLDVLRKRTAKWGIDLTSCSASAENVSANLRDDASWIQPCDPVGSDLIESIRTDVELYDFAQTLA